MPSNKDPIANAIERAAMSPDQGAPFPGPVNLVDAIADLSNSVYRGLDLIGGGANLDDHSLGCNIKFGLYEVADAIRELAKAVREAGGKRKP